MVLLHGKVVGNMLNLKCLGTASNVTVLFFFSRGKLLGKIKNFG